MNENLVSPSDHYECSRVSVLDTEMSYVDASKGEPVVLLHSNSTS